MAEDLELEQHERTRVRVFGLIAVALLILGTLVFFLTGIGGGLFADRSTIRTYMADGAGLTDSGPVRLNGILIGKIDSVRLTASTDPRRVIEIDMGIKDRFLPSLPVDSVAAISADNLLGDKYINITRGKSSRIVQGGGELPSLIQNDTFNQADLVASLETNLKRLDDLLTQIESPGTKLGQFVQGQEFYDQLRGQIEGIQTAITSYTSPRSEIGKSLFRKELYDKVRAPILNFDNMLAQIQRGEGPGGRWLKDPAIYDDARKNVAEIRQSLDDLNAGKGPAGKLLADEEMYRQIQKLVNSMESVIDGINSGEGMLGQMLSSGQLYDSLNGQSRELRDLLKEFRTNPRKFMRIKVF
ncbi:MAG: MlaD family protein [Acidobacteriota bacterium]|nr:MlaD family protein [Acidobacteriota bacterium]